MEVTELISSVGFPIAAFLLMFWMAQKQIKENTEVLKDLKEVVRDLKNKVKHQ